MNGKKGDNRGGIIIGILIVLAIIICGVLFVSWLFGDDEDDGYDYYDENYVGYHNPNGNGNQGNASVTNGGSVTRDSISELIDISAVREKQVKLKGNGEDTVTILMYVNGSDLESEDGEATTDLSEIIAGAGNSDKVNILVQTMGTKTWKKELGIASNHTQRYKLDGSGLKLLKDDLGQLDCTRPETLSDFIKWGATNYPADRYILLFWNHGGGSVYGFGYDQWVSDEKATLTIDEIQDALHSAGVFFDFIGMDCCIMSTLETCCAFYDYCDYAILSEDFESGLGWAYTNWIKKLYANTSIPTTELGTIIVDDMVSANTRDSEWGDESIMTLIDESMIKVLYTAWTDFAYANTNTLTSKNYSRAMKPKQGGRVHPLLKRGLWDSFYSYYTEDEYSLSDYYEVDIMSAASSISSGQSDVLQAALAATLVHTAYTSGDSNLTGLAVTLPYGDSEAYSSMRTIFSNIGMDSKYISWLEQFVYSEASDNYYDYSDFDDSWDGWDDYEEDYDWSDWDYYDDEEYWDGDFFGFSDFDFLDSFNSWLDNHDDYGYDWEEDWYDDDDWYYDDWFSDDYYGYGGYWY